VRRGVALAAGLGLLAAGFLVAAGKPGDEFLHAPFATRGQVGDRLESHYLVVRALDAQLAHEVVLDGWTGTTSGLWLVVDMRLGSRTESMSLGAELLVGEVRYDPTTRVDNLDGQALDAGLPVSGPILIELPKHVLDDPGAHSAVLRLGPGFDMRLDSAVEIDLDLTALEVVDVAEPQPVRDGVE
jgi:hypothetical protein